MPISIPVALLASILVFVVGLVIAWSNPRRAANRAVFLCSCNIAAWLACLFLTTNAVERSDTAFQWFRITCSVGTFVPFMFLMVREAIAGTFNALTTRVYVRWGIWLAGTAAVAYLPRTANFARASSIAGGEAHQWVYWGFIALNLMLYVFLLIGTGRLAKVMTGVQRLELQVWLLGGCMMTTAIFTLMILREMTTNRNYIVYLQPIAVLGFYAATVYTITSFRIFDARQVVLVGLQKILLVAVVAATAFVLDWALEGTIDSRYAFLIWFIDAAITLWVAFSTNDWLNKAFHFYPQDTEARQAAHAAARSYTTVSGLEQAFLGILKGWGKTDRAVLLSGNKAGLAGGGIEMSEDSVVPGLMQELKWVTPERIAREKETPDRQVLSQFLTQHGLGVLVSTDGPSQTVLIGVGVPATRRPYTYPQVSQLLELASIVESALERTLYLVKAQQAEQLATVGLLGASLAHEIRNPLVSIKTFVQLLPKHHADPAFRDKFFRLISDEVGRIDRLTEQLLEMAAPRVYTASPLHLNPLVKSSLDLVAAKADDRQIKLVSDFEAAPDIALTDPTATKQVLLNLCFNAVHAVEGREGDRWIKVATRNVGDSIEVAVSDSGPGIAPEVLPRLFQPFQTTKSTGFGLGLAICSDILSGLKATIVADPPRPGSGATFRVRFPCPPLSS